MTATCLGLGAVAVSGLPPFGLFVSELTVLAGGAAQLIAPQLNGAVEVVDNLVLEGIVHIAHDSLKAKGAGR